MLGRISSIISAVLHAQFCAVAKGVCNGIGEAVNFMQTGLLKFKKKSAAKGVKYTLFKRHAGMPNWALDRSSPAPWCRGAKTVEIIEKVGMARYTVGL